MNVAALRAQVEAVATPAQRKQAEAYFKGALPFLGARGPDVDALFKAARPALGAMAAPARFALATELLSQEPAELRHLGVLLLSQDHKLLPADWLSRLAPVLRRQATNWGTADAFAGRVLRYRLPVDADRLQVVAWAQDPSPWLRRIAAVCFVNEARKGVYAAEIAVVVAGALALDHRFSQLGAGWLLRERWRADPAGVEAFLRREGWRMQREAVRYAVEKMPTALRLELMAATKQAPAAG